MKSLRVAALSIKYQEQLNDIVEFNEDDGGRTRQANCSFICLGCPSLWTTLVIKTESIA